MQKTSAYTLMVIWTASSGAIGGATAALRHDLNDTNGTTASALTFIAFIIIVGASFATWRICEANTYEGGE